MTRVVLLRRLGVTWLELIMYMLGKVRSGSNFGVLSQGLLEKVRRQPMLGMGSHLLRERPAMKSPQNWLTIFRFHCSSLGYGCERSAGCITSSCGGH
ncbi:hypothetical protein XcyCFBP4188_20235 [Xanthomonas hortorum pv. cynarae]|nr:hypothetical protein XcyCFBP4188_20235 [Xanthomonas hortorum pv. cynarae]